jgi:hypothetical protein
VIQHFPVLFGGGTDHALTRDWVSRGGVFESLAQKSAMNRLFTTLSNNGDTSAIRYLNLRIGGTLASLLVPALSVNTTLDTNNGVVIGNYSNASGITWTGSASITTGLPRASALLANGGLGYGCALAQSGASTECMGVLGTSTGAGRILLNPNFSGTQVFHNIGDSANSTPGITTLTRLHATASAAAATITLYRNNSAVSTSPASEVAAGGTFWAVGRGPNAIANTGCRICCDWVTFHTNATQWGRIDAAIAQFLTDIGRS